MLNIIVFVFCSCLVLKQTLTRVVVLLVLTAINEDSPTVPALLTDYILNGKCVYIQFWHVCAFVLS